MEGGSGSSWPSETIIEYCINVSFISRFYVARFRGIARRKFQRNICTMFCFVLTVFTVLAMFHIQTGDCKTLETAILVSGSPIFGDHPKKIFDGEIEAVIFEHIIPLFPNGTKTAIFWGGLNRKENVFEPVSQISSDAKQVKSDYTKFMNGDRPSAPHADHKGIGGSASYAVENIFSDSETSQRNLIILAHNDIEEEEINKFSTDGNVEKIKKIVFLLFPWNGESCKTTQESAADIEAHGFSFICGGLKPDLVEKMIIASLGLDEKKPVEAEAEARVDMKKSGAENLNLRAFVVILIAFFFSSTM